MSAGTQKAHLPRRFLYTITHSPNVVFMHHLPPISRLFFYTVAHPPNGGFRTPSPTHPMVVFVHHRAPISREFLYTIAHPPNGGFHTIAYPSLTAIFVHHRAPAQGWFSYTIVHPSHGGFLHHCTPIQWQFLYTSAVPSTTLDAFASSTCLYHLSASPSSSTSIPVVEPQPHTSSFRNFITNPHIFIPLLAWYPALVLMQAKHLPLPSQPGTESIFFLLPIRSTNGKSPGSTTTSSRLFWRKWTRRSVD